MMDFHDGIRLLGIVMSLGFGAIAVTASSAAAAAAFLISRKGYQWLTSERIDAIPNKKFIPKEIAQVLFKDLTKVLTDDAHVWAKYIITKMGDNFKGVSEKERKMIEPVIKEMEKLAKSQNLVKTIISDFNTVAALDWYESNDRPGKEKLRQLFQKDLEKTTQALKAKLGESESTKIFIEKMKFLVNQNMFSYIMQYAKQGKQDEDIAASELIIVETVKKIPYVDQATESEYTEFLKNLLNIARKRFHPENKPALLVTTDTSLSSIPLSKDTELSTVPLSKDTELSTVPLSKDIGLPTGLSSVPLSKDTSLSSTTISNKTSLSTDYKNTGESESLMDNRGGRVDFSANPKALFGPPREARGADFGSIDLGVLGDAYICGLGNSNRKTWMLLPSCLQQFAYHQLFKTSVARLQLKKNKDPSKIDISQIFLM